MKHVYRYTQQWHLLIILAIGLKGISTGIDLMIPYLMGVLIDTGIVDRNLKISMQLCGIMFILAVVGCILTVISHYCSSKGAQKIGESLRNNTYQHIQSMAIKDVEQISTGSLIMRVTHDIDQIQQTVIVMARMMVRAPLILVGGTVAALTIDVYLTGILFIGMGIVFFISILMFRIVKPIYRQAQRQMDGLAEKLRERINGVRTIKAFNKQGDEVARIDLENKKIYDLEIKAGKLNASMGPSITIVSNVSIIVVLLIGGMRVQGGSLEIGQIVIIIQYINMIMMAVTMLPRIFMMMSRTSASIGRLEEIFDIKEEALIGEIEESLVDEPILAFQDVCFGYPGMTGATLKHISFEIKKGEIVGIIGGTGSGKTTLIQLLLQLYQPTNGKIMYRGLPLTAYKRELLKKKITAAIQNYHIFSMSIKDNVMLDKDFDREKLSEAVRVAQLEDVLSALVEEEGYLVSQNGMNLSGGQKQRLSIARTLYREAEVIVLDDVSSALDYQTDVKLRQAICNHYKEQTLIIASQRLSSVRYADKIIVMDKGKVVGVGTHDTLCKTCAVYQTINKVQGESRREAI